MLRLSDTVAQEFRNTLSAEMVYLLSFSLALSENGELKQALAEEDENIGYEILSDLTQRFKKYTHMKSLRLQVFTPEFFIFARSWNEGFEGMPIWWFRDDLKTLKNNTEPKVGMETGRLLTFKSTIPIRRNNQLLGYLEVIELVDEFSERLREQGIELFTLMDEVYLEKASLMRNFPRLFGKVIANQNYHATLKDQIMDIEFDHLVEKQFLQTEDHFFLWEPMYNGVGKKIGGYLLVLPSASLEQFRHNESSFSILKPFSDKDIKYVIESREKQLGSFRTRYDKDLIDVLPKLFKEDKKELEAEAREILKYYRKEELINIILNQNNEEKKIGTIQ